jgi:hypothetical protein
LLFAVLLALVGCGPKSVAARMKSADKKSDRIAALLDDVERDYESVDPKKAEEELQEAATLLADPDMQYSPEREMFATRHAELVPRLESVRAARRAKDIEDAVRAERAEIGPSLQTMKDAAEALAAPKVDEKRVDAARDAVETLEKAVGSSDDRRTLALKDASFVGYLKRAKTEAANARTEVSKGEKKLKFLEGPVALKHQAGQELKESRKEKDLEKRRELIVSAINGYFQCQKTGSPFTRGGFGTEKLLIEGATTSIEAFLDTCKAAQQSTEQALAKLPKPSKPKKKK